jgi:hypothetical protein
MFSTQISPGLARETLSRQNVGLGEPAVQQRASAWGWQQLETANPAEVPPRTMGNGNGLASSSFNLRPGANGDACAGRMGETPRSISAARQVARIIWLAERNCFAAVQASCKEDPMCSAGEGVASRLSPARPSRISVVDRNWMILSGDGLRGTTLRSRWRAPTLDRHGTRRSMPAALGWGCLDHRRSAQTRLEDAMAHWASGRRAETGCETALMFDAFIAPPLGSIANAISHRRAWTKAADRHGNCWDGVPINSSGSACVFRWPCRQPRSSPQRHGGEQPANRSAQRGFGEDLSWRPYARERDAVVRRVRRRPSRSSSRLSVGDMTCVESALSAWSRLMAAGRAGDVGCGGRLGSKDAQSIETKAGWVTLMLAVVPGRVQNHMEHI